ncbi:hypothetical protein GGR56DRAFT_355464 [Xylariaceae sp. FL0804]|nr:hypothetical protein GGR56DRAFT_355464 [Xylariaceae sp. FL0804]
MAPPKYHKFRGGERCDECGARQWYAQDALRYCRNGHRLEGFAAHEADEDAAFDQRLGATTRRRKERRERVAAKLAGDDARELYLEALQLLLLRQVRWLLLPPTTSSSPGDQAQAQGGGSRGEGGGGGRGGPGLPPELEDVVRALWSLRVRNLPLRELDADGGKGKKGRSRSRSRRGESDGDGDGGGGGGGGDSNGEAFASQSQTDVGDSSGAGLSDADAGTQSSWAPDRRRRWKLPRLVDTLALCYLGCLVRRLPVTVGDFHRWAQKGDIDYLAAINCLPRNVRDRLPAEYHGALQVRDHLPPGHLQSAVQDLVISFKANFDLVFPPLNYVPPLIRYMIELALPVEIYPTVGCLAEILQADYSYPTKGSKIRTMENPEVLLITLVVVSAKILYPLDGTGQQPRTHYGPRATAMNWTKWQEVMAEEPAERLPNLIRGEEYKVTANDALSLDKPKLDDFMDWFEQMWLGNEDPKTERIREPFLGEKRTTEPSQQEPDAEADRHRIKKRYAALDYSIKLVGSAEGDTEPEVGGANHARDFCPVWRAEEDLPEVAKAFYRKAAELAAIPLNTLIRSAAQVERQLEIWCLRKSKEKQDSIEKGKGIQTDQDTEGWIDPF